MKQNRMSAFVAAALVVVACSDSGPTATRSALKPTQQASLDKVAATGSVTGALFTTNTFSPACGAVNVNQYELRTDVYVNGGGAGADQLPNGWYYVRVVAPGGAVLGTSVADASNPTKADLVLEVAGNTVVGCPRLWDLVKQADGTDGFAVSTNGGGVYKVEIGTDPTFEHSRKSDNFKVNEGVTSGNVVLDIDKTIGGGFVRSYQWTITKACDPTVNAAAPGASTSINCSVTIGSATPAYKDGSYAISGLITITNPSQTAAIAISNVTDNLVVTLADNSTVTPSVGVSCTAQSGLSFVIAPGASQSCTYSYTVPSAQAGAGFRNTATVYYNDGSANTSSTSNAYAFAFGSTPASENYKTATVTDAKYSGGSPAGTLGTITFGDIPKTFTFAYTAAAPAACSSTTVSNVASITETSQSTDPAYTSIAAPCTLSVRKFYDRNNNGTFDTDEPEFGVGPLAGWPVSVTGPNGYAKSGNTKLTLADVFAGTYVASEGTSLPAGYQVTAAYYYANAAPGVLLGSSASTTKSVTLTGTVPTTVVFGNACTRASTGKTMGFWSNNNGQSLLLTGKDPYNTTVTLMAGDKAWRGLLDALNLQNAGGTAYFTDLTPYSTFIDGTKAGQPYGGAYGTYRDWLLTASSGKSVTAGYMLSAQLSALVLDRAAGYVNDADIVIGWAGVGGDKSVKKLIDEANRILAIPATGITVPSGYDLRSYQTYTQSIINTLNNQTGIVRPFDPCPF
jgi:hypothetical protein